MKIVQALAPLLLLVCLSCSSGSTQTDNPKDPLANPATEADASQPTTEATASQPATKANPAAPEPEEYVACGCGCCGGTPAPGDPELTVNCLYRAKGDSMAKIIEDDKRSRSQEICKRAGCSQGRLYRYCD